MLNRTEAACKIRIVRHHTQIFFHECIVDPFGFCEVGQHLGTQLTLGSVPSKSRRPRQTVCIGNLEEKVCHGGWMPVTNVIDRRRVDLAGCRETGSN